MPEPSPRLAVLIDADNASANTIGNILAEIASLGMADIKRVYGDFTRPNLNGWKKAAVAHAIVPVQHFGNTVGKNASDSALIIDAMDLLHARKLNGFCLVSSDSDFTRLATRIREDGLLVYGFGEQKTPASFIAACSSFVFTERFRAKNVGASPAATAASSHPPRDLAIDANLRKALAEAVEAAMTKAGRAHLPTVHKHLTAKIPDFNCRNYGFTKFVDLVERVLSLTLPRNTNGQRDYIDRGATC